MIKAFVFNPDNDDNTRLNWYGNFFHDKNIQFLFKKNDIEIVEHDPNYNCDCVIGYWRSWNNRVKFFNFPYKIKFLMEYNASSHSKSIDDALEYDCVKGIFKHSVIRDMDEYYKDRPIYRNASHAYAIAQEFPEILDEDYYKNETRIMTEKEISMMKSIVHIGCPVLFTPPYVVRNFLNMTTRSQVLNLNRKIDIFFSGTVFYKYQPYLSFIIKHRSSIYENLLKLQKEYNCVILKEGERINQRSYQNMMINSKISISPYGIGEYCYRDFESLIAGCETIKPDMSFTKTYPDIYDPKYDAFITLDKCRDFDELRRKIDFGLKRFSDQQRAEKRAKIFDMIKDSYNEEYVVKNMASVIKQAMNK